MKIKRVYKGILISIAISLAIVGATMHLTASAGSSLGNKIAENIKKMRAHNISKFQLHIKQNQGVINE